MRDIRDILVYLDTGRAKHIIPLRVRSGIRAALPLLVFAVAYLAAYFYQKALPLPAPFYPAGAVLISALLLVPLRRWWLYLFAASTIYLAIDWSLHVPLWLALIVTAANAIEPTVTVLVLRRFVSLPPRFAGLREVSIFAACVIAGTILSASVGASGASAAGIPFWPTWRMWFLSNSLADLVLAPTILLWIGTGFHGVRAASRWRVGEAMLLGGELMLVGLIVFRARIQGADTAPVLLYVALPFLVWAAVRFGPRGIASALSLVAVLAITGTAHGSGPFISQSTAAAVFTLQVFVFATGVPLLFLAALMQEREETKATLQESEARFRTMADQAPVLIWMSDPDALCTFFNAGWLAFTGRTQAQEHGTGWAAGVHPDDMAGCLDTYLRAVAARQPFKLEYRLRRHDGAYRWLVDNGVPRYAPNGRFEGYIGSAIDITDRKQAEEALRESEARFRAAFKSAVTGMMLVDTAGHPLQVNRPLAEMLGYTEEELRTHTFTSLTHPDDRDANMELFRKALAGEIDSYQLEKRFIHKQGHLVWGHLSAGVVRDAVGRPLYLVGQVQDITERKQAEEALRESEERYRAVVNNFPHGAVLLFTEDLRHLVADGQGLPEIGLSKELVAGKTLWEAFPTTLAARLAPRYQAALADVAATFDVVENDRTYHVQTLPVRHRQVTAGMAVIQDVTEQRRAQALAELDRAKTAFFSNVSHELRTPLTLLLGPAADALEDHDEPLPPRQRERLELIQRSGLHLHKLVNTLLDFSRIEAGSLHPAYEPTDLATLTAELAGTFRSVAERAGLRLVVDCPPLTTLPQPVYVDRDMWEKIVFNLLSNALKFTFEGEITVTVHAASGQFDLVELEVRDTGTGIPAETLPHLFERFYRVQGARARIQEGTGIGLALVHDLVRLHNGTVRVASTMGEGSSFTVSLPTGLAHLPAGRIAGRALPGKPASPASNVLGAIPLIEEAPRWLPQTNKVEHPEQKAVSEETPLERVGSHEMVVELPEAGATALAPRGHPLAVPFPRSRVLVADDNTDICEYLRRLLRELYDVEVVHDGQAALAAVQAHRPDLVLSDVMMPGLDGFALLRALRADPTTREIPVLLLSARAGEEATVEGLAAGADDYLVKPFATRELLARIRTHLELARVRGEAAAHAAQLDTIFDAMTDGVFVLDDEGRTIRLNPAARQFFGLTRGDEVAQMLDLDDAIGQQLSSEQAPTVRLRRGEVLAGANAMTLRLRAHDGLERTVSLTGGPLRDAMGRIVGAVGVLRDVTELKRIEAALAEQEHLFRTLVENSPDIITRFDRNLRHLYVSPAAEAVTGLPARTRIGKTYAELALPETLFGVWDDALREVIATGEPRAFETRFELPNTPIRYSHVRYIPEFAADGSVESILGITSDITQLKQAEVRVMEQASQLEAIFEAQADGVAVFDMHGRFVRTNRALRHLLGVDAEGDLMTHPFSERVHRLPLFDEQGQPVSDEQQPHLRVLHGEILAGASAMDGCARTSDGREVWVSTTGAPMRAPDGHITGAVLIARDVTARRRLERQVREQERLFRTLVENLPDIIARFDRDLRLLYLSPRMKAVSGLPVEELVDNTHAALGIPEELYTAVAQALAQVITMGEHSAMEFDYTGPAGTHTYFARLIPERTEDGSVESVLTVATDVTERKRTEEALRAAKAAADAAKEEEHLRRQEAERREQIAESLREVLVILNSNRPVTKILDYIVWQAGRLLDSDAVAIYATNGVTGTAGVAVEAAGTAPVTLALQAAYGLRPSRSSTRGEGRLAAGHAALRRAVAQRRPVAVLHAPTARAQRDSAAGWDTRTAATAEGLGKAVADYIEVRVEPLPAPYRALLALPIVVQDEVYGGMLLLYSAPHCFSTDEVALAMAYGDQVALAIANARLQLHIEQAATEAERNRLARELHDTVTQEIFAASLLAEAIPKVWEQHRAEAEESLQQLHQLTRSALATLRALLLELRPGVLEQGALDELLRQLGDAMTTRAGVPISLTVTDDCLSIPTEVKVALYRIAQEALTNAAKHAAARHITVSLRGLQAGEAIQLEVRDDGQGFATSVVPAGHFGMGTMRERARAIGATLRIKSQQGQGTRVVVEWKGRTRMGKMPRQVVEGLRG